MSQSAATAQAFLNLPTSENLHRHLYPLFARPPYVVDYLPFQPMKITLTIAIAALAFTGCETVTTYQVDGGKTVIKRPHETSMKLVLRSIELAAPRYQTNPQK